MIEFLNDGHEFWDQNLLKQSLPEKESERNIVVVPGANKPVEEVNEHISKYLKVLVIITSDEENKFAIDELTHPDMIVYVQYPQLPKHQNVDRLFPIGYPPRDKQGIETKKLPWFYAGQVNHDSRRELVEVLRNTSGGKLIESEGFSQGLPYPGYLKWMNYASTAPAPGGPLSPDSFRTYEALEAGAVPITDKPEFWQMIFDKVPFPTLKTWETLPALINNLKDRPEENNKCFAWWQRKKIELRWMIEEDLNV